MMDLCWEMEEYQFNIFGNFYNIIEEVGEFGDLWYRWGGDEFGMCW